VYGNGVYTVGQHSDCGRRTSFVALLDASTRYRLFQLFFVIVCYPEVYYMPLDDCEESFLLFDRLHFFFLSFYSRVFYTRQCCDALSNGLSLYLLLPFFPCSRFSISIVPLS